MTSKGVTASRVRVLGVDACKPGWVGIALSTTAARAYFAVHIDELVADVIADGSVAAIAIDIPIGLPDAGPRAADLLARNALGARRSCVFVTPVRPALMADHYTAAVAINRELAHAGVSRQAFNLKEKLLDVDRWLLDAPCRVVEVHPELSFAALHGSPVAARKTTWAGMEIRRKLLAQQGIPLSSDLGRAGQLAAVDDVLDAAVCAWTARRVANGAAVSLPDPPERFGDGIACAIWY
jgi:predicted RNase H-like nuclease